MDIVRDLIAPALTPVASGKNGVFKFRMAVYRWEEINKSMNVLQDPNRGADAGG